MSANDTQVAGAHYRSSIQHWDFVIANELNYFEGQITKYVTRCRKKGQTLQDLEKAQHFLQKYIEHQRALLEAEDFFAQQERAQSMRNTGA